MTKLNKVTVLSCFALYLLSCYQILEPFSNLLRFSIICICAIIALHYGNWNAALFTVTSDVFLLFTDWYKIGIFFFCMVQISYMSAILKKPFPYICLLLGLVFPFIPLEMVGAIYAGLFVSHFYLAFKHGQELSAKTQWLYVLGIFLFACCDVLVALRSNQALVHNLIWLFYTPSQILLAFNARQIPSKEQSRHQFQ